MKDNNLIELDVKQKELITFITSLLLNAKLPDLADLDQKLLTDDGFKMMYKLLLDIREFTSLLSKGLIQKDISSKGFIMGNLKSLQSDLRHMVWQLKRIAEGDYSQRVDFLGDFSLHFNEMSSKLNITTNLLTEQARLDPLTRLNNRLVLEQFILKAFSEARHNKTEISVLMMDIDFFKRINDTYTHSVGDQVLVQIANILNKQFRTCDCLARYGGEEFVAVLTTTDAKNAQIVAERTLEAIKNHTFLIDSGIELKLTISIGVATLTSNDSSGEDIIKRSDLALYDAKNSGRNKICIR